jgi:hypothetical protein
MSALNIPPLPDTLKDSGDALEAFLRQHCATEDAVRWGLKLLTNHALLVSTAEYRAAWETARQRLRFREPHHAP